MSPVESILKTISDFWPAIGAAVGFLIWLLRLEGRINHAEIMNGALARDLEHLHGKHEALDNKVVESLSQIRESLARIEGRLMHDNGKP